MAMKLYRVGRTVFQYEEGAQPAGAVPVGPAPAKAPAKAAAPANKARAAKNKARP